MQQIESMKKLKVIISGGGTGGHIFPALAIAKAIEKKVENVDFHPGNASIHAFPYQAYHL